MFDSRKSVNRETSWIASAGQWSIRALKSLRIQAFSVHVAGHCRVNVWSKNSACPGPLSAEGWQQIASEDCKIGVNRVAIRQTAIARDEVMSFYMATGGFDFIFYEQCIANVHGDSAIEILPGRFNNKKGRHWDALDFNGEFVGSIEYRCVPTTLNAHEVLARDIAGFLGSDLLTDFELVAGSCAQRVRVHGFVLAARSPVFANMLRTPMLESTNKEIVLRDIEMPILDLMLQYMYGKELSLETVKTDFVLSLLNAAHQFELHPLVEFCSSILEFRVDTGNVSEILQMADARGLTSLRAVCMDYIVEYADKVHGTAGFKNLATKYPSLMLEVFGRVVDPKTKKREVM